MLSCAMRLTCSARCRPCCRFWPNQAYKNDSPRTGILGLQLERPSEAVTTMSECRMSLSQTEFSIHSADPRAWLEHLPANRRSAIANLFHHAVRGGHTTPATVVHQVQQEVHRRRQWASDHVDLEHLQTVLNAIEEDRTGAIAYAAAVIAYEQLPYDARQRVKAERAIPYLQEAMRGQPVTEKQTAYLRALRYTGPQPEDRAAASALIDQLTREGARP